MNQTFVDHYTTQAIAASDAGNFQDAVPAAIASTIADVGTSIFNSVVVGIPKLLGIDTKEYSASTFDLLSSVNSDWANFYRSNEDAISTASFVAGSLLPMGVALKGMKLLQAGKIGLFPGVLSDAAQTGRITKLTAMMTDGAADTSEFAALRWKILGVDAAQQTAQAAGMEVALLATFNEHPFLEDYFKDPIKNFGISVLAGGVIGGGIGQVILRKQLTSELGAVASGALKQTTDKLVVVPHGLSDNDLFQRLLSNADIAEGVAADETLNPLAKQIATKFASVFKGAAANAYEKVEGSNLAKLTGADGKSDTITRMAVKDFMGRESNFGAQGVELASFGEDTLGKSPLSTFKPAKGKLPLEDAMAAYGSDEFDLLSRIQRQGLISSLELQKLLPQWKQLMEHDFAVYHSPHFDAYIPFDKVKQYIRAVDTGQRDFRTSPIFKLNGDASAELVTREVSTALADRAWVDALGTAASVDTPKQVFVHANDLPAINAWVSKAAAQEELGVEQTTKYFMSRSISDTQSVMKQQASEVSLEDLTAHLATQKEQIARSLFAEGASFQEISLRINSSADTVERMFTERAPLSSYPGWRSYTNAADITTDYLHPSGQMLKLTTNGSRAASLRYRNADMSANLDQKFLKNADREISSNVIRAVGSKIAEDLFLSFKANDALFDTMDAAISNVVNPKLGSIGFSDTTFATRHMGEISQAAGYIGQRNIGIMNTHAKALLTDLSAAIHSHTSSQAGLNEINAIFTHLNGLSGYRNWDEVNGVLYKMVPGPDGVLFKQTIRPSAIADLLPRDQFRDTFSPGAQAILTQLKAVSEQMYLLKNTINRIQGFKELDNIGLHIPTFNPNNKFMSYIIDTTTQNKDQKVRMLIGKSPEELASLEQRWLSENSKSLRPGVDLVRMSDKEAYNAVKMRLDPMDMDFADVNKFHSGASASAVRVVDDSLTGTLIENLHGRVLHYSRQLQEMYLHETMSTLDMMSKLNRGLTDAQPIAAKSIGTHQGDDAALVIKNMILGNNQLSNMTTWKNFNNGVSSTIDYVSAKVHSIWNSFGSNYTREDGPLGLKDWVKHTKELEGVGVTNPFTNYDEYVAMSQPGAKTFQGAADYAKQVEQLKVDSVSRIHSISHASAEQIVAAGNGIIATAALRVLEMGQPFVNAISVPILMLPELMRNLPKTFLGHEITGQGVGVAFPARVMYDGVRFRFSDAAKPWVERWTKEGIGTSIVSEASQLHALTYSEGGGSVAKLQRMLSDPKGIISKLSTPADRMEIETRLVTLSTAVQVARTAYPGITDEAANVFAYSFLNRVIGNYSAAQRPALFQGTVGVALGLFQTYMLSWGQSMYRSIEEGAGKALAAQMLTQAGLFGISSLPGYDLMSKTIASHFSDKHYDLTTGTYRALPNALAEFITYGLPSSLGVGLYTRGDLQPRIPVVSQASPEDQVAAVNVAKQFYGVTAHAMTKVMEAQGMGAKVRGLLEGLSMQSLSRPIARIAETIPLPDGEGGVSAVGSVSREGSTIATSSEVWSTPGILSRLLSSRSTEEAVKREMDYMASFHATLDSQNKKKTTETLKTAIRAGTLSEPGVMEKISGEYLRSGTATGWQSAVNEAVATSVGGIDHKLEKRLKPEDPLQQMISTNF